MEGSHCTLGHAINLSRMHCGYVSRTHARTHVRTHAQYTEGTMWIIFQCWNGQIYVNVINISLNSLIIKIHVIPRCMQHIPAILRRLLPCHSRPGMTTWAPYYMSRIRCRLRSYWHLPAVDLRSPPHIQELQKYVNKKHIFTIQFTTRDTHTIKTNSHIMLTRGQYIILLT